MTVQLGHPVPELFFKQAHERPARWLEEGAAVVGVPGVKLVEAERNGGHTSPAHLRSHSGTRGAQSSPNTTQTMPL